MNNSNPTFDVTGRQRRWEQEGKALDKFLEATEHIKGMEAELNRHSEQFKSAGRTLEGLTSESAEHNRQLSLLNDQLRQESKAREKADKSNRWFSVAMAFLSFVLGIVASHYDAIITWAKSLLRLISHP